MSGRARFIVVSSVMAALVACAAPAAQMTPGCDYPAQTLDLTNWELTLPTGERDNPTEVKQPQLAAFAVAPWFTVVDPCDGVQFRAPVDGVTTSGSSYPRAELREMENGGRDAARWSSTSGEHIMRITQSIDHLPADKPHVVAGQVHDSTNDVSVFRLEGTNLYVTNGDDTHHKLVTTRYRLGTRFEAKFVVTDGQIEAYYNGTRQTTIPRRFSRGYFKAGAYTQANCSNSSPCDRNNFGEVMIYDLSVMHS